MSSESQLPLFGLSNPVSTGKRLSRMATAVTVRSETLILKYSSYFYFRNKRNLIQELSYVYPNGMCFRILICSRECFLLSLSQLVETFNVVVSTYSWFKEKTRIISKSWIVSDRWIALWRIRSSIANYSNYVRPTIFKVPSTTALNESFVCGGKFVFSPVVGCVKLRCCDKVEF